LKENKADATREKVLDIGCAAGFILKGFEDSGWICRGIEPNETMAKAMRHAGPSPIFVLLLKIKFMSSSAMGAED